MASWRTALDRTIDDLADELRSVRRYLHAHPEPSGGEFQTTLFLAGRLREADLRFRIVPSERGILVDGGADDDERRIAIRSDMDALRIHEENEVEYRSIHDGLMHACGHDAHATIVLGATLALHRCRDRLPDSVAWRAVFQPAEETSEGALEMCAAGAVDGVAAIAAVHVDPELACGRVATRHGPLSAFCEGIEIVIEGRGGHAARPHHTVDPISAAVQFVNSIYHFIPRSVDSRDPVVVSFGVIDGGANPNVIPEQVRLAGTIRTVTRTSFEHVKRKIDEIARGTASASEANIRVAYHLGPDAVINDPHVTDTCVSAAREVVGDDRIDTIRLPSMGGEDFSAYLAHVPGCLLRLGAAGVGPRAYLHSPRFDIDERALTIGAKVLARAVVLLGNNERRERP